jgi:DNA-binding NtrC family response regulator
VRCASRRRSRRSRTVTSISASPTCACPTARACGSWSHVSQHAHDLPVAVITAHGNTENAVAALKAGAFDYLAKPVSLEQLRSLVKSALSLPAVVQQKPGGGERGA